MKTRTLLTLVLLLVGGTLACSSRQSDPAPPAAAATRITVDNQKFLDVNIYVYRGSQRARLGTVTGGSRRTFTIPASFIFGITTLRFEADPIGSRESSVSHEINVREGETVYMVVPS